jgi:hypothetical protein
MEIQRRLLNLVLASALGVALLGCHSSRSLVPGVTVLPGRNDPQVAVEIYPDRAVLDIESPCGIGSATVELLERFHPRHLSLRLHLRGLEELRFTYAGRTVITSLAANGSHEVRERLLKNGAERMLVMDDRHWMKVRLAGGAVPVIPLREGWIEVDVPRDFAKSGARHFAIEWVDFFR